MLWRAYAATVSSPAHAGAVVEAIRTPEVRKLIAGTGFGMLPEPVQAVASRADLVVDFGATGRIGRAFGLH